MEFAKRCVSEARASWCTGTLSRKLQAMVVHACGRTGCQATCCVQGNCSQAQSPGDLDPPRLNNNQCLIIVKEDFLEVASEGSPLWMSDLYVKLPGVEKNHSTLVGVHGSDVYLTNMAFIGDNNKARAIDMWSGRKLYIASAHPLLAPWGCSGRCVLD